MVEIALVNVHYFSHACLGTNFERVLCFFLLAGRKICFEQYWSTLKL